MPKHSVVFDPDDPACPVCGSENVDWEETDRYERVWTCGDCGQWSRSVGYKLDTPL